MWQFDADRTRVVVTRPREFLSGACVTRKRLGLLPSVGVNSCPCQGYMPLLRIHGVFAFGGRCFVVTNAGLLTSGGSLERDALRGSLRRFMLEISTSRHHKTSAHLTVRARQLMGLHGPHPRNTA